MKLCKITFLLILIPSIIFAHNKIEKKKHEKTKSISKTFDVNKDARLEVYNKFGDINITTWDKDRIEIDVTITVKGNDLDDVEGSLEKISVDFEASSSLVTARTRIGSKNSWSIWKKRRNKSYKINYTIKMPISNDLNLNNDYGRISLDELKGKAEISCDYGEIEIGDLKGDNSEISLDYCKASSIESMKDGQIRVDYSNITIDEATDINLNTDYSTVTFGEVKILDFSADYGSIRVDNGVSISGSGDYSGLKFGNITKKLNVSADYGSIRIKNLVSGFELVDINSEFASIKIGIESGISFDFIVDLQYAGFKRDNSKIDMRKSIVKNSKKYYEGTFGKSGSSSNIKIKSEYGSVTFDEN